jgi:hypothetical protein
MITDVSLFIIRKKCFHWAGNMTWIRLVDQHTDELENGSLLTANGRTESRKSYFANKFYSRCGPDSVLSTLDLRMHKCGQMWNYRVIGNELLNADIFLIIIFCPAYLLLHQSQQLNKGSQSSYYMGWAQLLCYCKTVIQDNIFQLSDMRYNCQIGTIGVAIIRGEGHCSQENGASAEAKFAPWFNRATCLKWVHLCYQTDLERIHW